MILPALLAAIAPTPANAGGAYELQFVPSGPIFAVEDDNSINFQVQVVGGCTPYAVTWEPEIQHVTTDSSDLGTPMPIPVGLSDIGPIIGITIPINNDVVIEDQESFFFKLTPSSMVDMNCTAPPTPPTESFYEIQIFLDDDEDVGDDHLVVKDATAVEGSGQIVFEVERVNANLAVAATASFVLVEDSATEGVDYLYPVGTAINFPMGGPTTQMVVIDLVDDSVSEPPETFYFKLTGAVNTAIGDYIGVGTILDDDDTRRVHIRDLTVDEGDETRTVQVEVRATTTDPPSGDTVTVGYVVEAGTAQPGEDFLLANGTLSFAPGDPIEFIPLQILGDTLPEDDEFFQIRLVNPDGAEIFDDVATITLLNDDASEGPLVSVDDAEVLEGDEGGTDVSLTVNLDGPLDFPFAIAYATEDGTAVAGADYEATEGLLEFAVGDTSKTVTVTVLGDLEDEADEMFRLRLSDAPVGAPSTAKRFGRRPGPGGSEPQPASAGQGTAKLAGDSEAVITIIDDDDTTGGDPPDVFVDDLEVTEGDEGVTPARFRIRLSEPASLTVRVQFDTVDGSATLADSDYQPRTGEVIFTPGQSEKFVTVPVLGDTRVEDDETFRLHLSGADGAVIVRNEAVCIIRNDDEEDDDGGGGGGDGGGRSVVRLLPTQPVTEGAGPAVIRLERIGSAQGPVRALVGAGGGTATAGQDYAAATRVAQWAAGQLGVVQLEIPIVDDARQEDGEFFFVRIGEAQNADIGSPSEARQVIVDDDTPMNLVALSDLEQTVGVGSELTLEARVERDDGEPVAGASVRWASQRKVLVTGDEVTISGADGIVRQTVRFAPEPGVARVGAVLVGADSRLEFRFLLQGNLDATIGEDDGDDGDIADAFDGGCAEEDEGDEFGEACDYLYGIEGDANRREALDRLTPRQALPHQRQALRAPRNQVRNVSARLTALRGGMNRSAFDQFALSIQGQGLGLSPLQSAIAGYDPGADAEGEIADRVDLALRRAAGLLSEEEARRRLQPARGGAASGDDSRSASRDDGFDAGGESPWGMFFNGRVSFGDAPRLGERPDFEFQTDGVTLGVDRRVGSHWVFGGALGYTQSETDVGANLGHLDLTGLSLSFYSTYYSDNWYVDGVLTYGQNEFDVERVIDLPVPFRGSTRLTAVGSPDATQTAANLGFGYDFRLGDALTLSGFVRANWTRAEIDGYTETGAALFDLQYDSQTLDSLLGEVGFELTWPVSFSWGVLQPLLRVASLHEFDNDLDVVRARFARGRSPRTFRLEGSATDRDFFNVAVAATATLRRGWATYLQYDTDLERDDLDLYTFSGGFRFQF